MNAVIYIHDRVYRRYVGEITDSEEMYFIVKFDTNDRVIAIGL